MTRRNAWLCAAVAFCFTVACGGETDEMHAARDPIAGTNDGGSGGAGGGTAGNGAGGSGGMAEGGSGGMAEGGSGGMAEGGSGGMAEGGSGGMAAGGSGGMAAGGSGGMAEGGSGGMAEGGSGGMAEGGSGGEPAIDYGDWQPTGGPPGILAWQFFATENGTLLGSNGSLLHRSTDGGLTWTQRTAIEDVYHDNIREVNGTIFLVRADDTLVASTDGGVSWGVRSTPYVASAPVGGPNGELWAKGSGSVLLRSSDGGYTWTEMQPPSTSSGSQLRSAGGILFWGSRVSTDGVNWQASSHPFSPEQVVAHGTSLYSRGAGSDEIRRSDDGGITWQMDDPFGGGDQVRCLLQPSGGTLYAVSPADVYRKDSSGWIRLGDGAGRCPDAAGGGWMWSRDPVSGDLSRWEPASNSWVVVPVASPWSAMEGIATSDDGVLIGWDHYARAFRSVDDGASWQQLPVRIHRDVAALGQSVWLAAERPGGLLRSADDGSTWQSVFPDLHLNDLAGLGGDVFATSGELFHSGDGGLSWSPALTSVSSVFVRDLMVDGTTLYASGRANRVGDPSGTWRSTDLGATATHVSDARFSDLVRVGTKLVAMGIAADGSNDIWHSTDDGQSWQRMNAAVPNLVGGTGYILKAAGTELFLLKAGTFRLWHSTDEGLSWSQLDVDLPAVATDFVVTDDSLFITLRGSGVWRYPLP